MKTENLLIILFVVAAAAMLIVAENKKSKRVVANGPLSVPAGFRTLSYNVPVDSDPVVFGPYYWAAFHDLASKIPCGTCGDFAEKFMIFFHDLVNLKLGKPLFNPVNFSEMSQLITTINLKGNRWPEA